MREEHDIRISTRKELWENQKGICVYCKRHISLNKASLDHIIPVLLLDRNIGPDNLVVCCRPCNYNKRDWIVFSNLFDKEIYPIIEIPYIFRYEYITKTKKVK